MWVPRWIIVAGFLMCLCFLGESASPLRGQKKPDSNQFGATSADDEIRMLDIRYARAYLKLMEATLGKYEEINRRIGKTIRPAVIEGLQESVREAQERIQLGENDDASDAKIYVSSAEADLRSAEESLRNAQIANSTNPGTVHAGEVLRRVAQVELAKVRIERARHLASESSLSNVRYELQLLREDVQELQLRVSLLMSRN
jgi:hypothetical protein